MTDCQLPLILPDNYTPDQNLPSVNISDMSEKQFYDLVTQIFKGNQPTVARAILNHPRFDEKTIDIIRYIYQVADNDDDYFKLFQASVRIATSGQDERTLRAILPFVRFTGDLMLIAKSHSLEDLYYLGCPMDKLMELHDFDCYDDNDWQVFIRSVRTH